MIEAIKNPRPEGVHFEENPLLAKLVQLWIAIEKASANELVEDTEHKRR